MASSSSNSSSEMIKILESKSKQLQKIVKEISDFVKLVQTNMPKKAVENFLILRNNASILLKLTSDYLNDAQANALLREEYEDILRWLDGAITKFSSLKGNLTILNKDLNLNSNIHPKTKQQLLKKKREKTISIEEYTKTMNGNSSSKGEKSKTERVHFRNNSNNTKEPPRKRSRSDKS